MKQILILILTIFISTPLFSQDVEGHFISDYYAFYFQDGGSTVTTKETVIIVNDKVCISNNVFNFCANIESTQTESLEHFVIITKRAADGSIFTFTWNRTTKSIDEVTYQARAGSDTIGFYQTLKPVIND